MIPFTYRFHGHGSLKYVYKNGQAVRSRLFIIKYIANQHRKKPRIAVIVSKKVLKSAVGRNRIRRRVYECIRLKLPELKGTYDIATIILSSEILNIPSPELNEQISQLFAQADMIK